MFYASVCVRAWKFVGGITGMRMRMCVRAHAYTFVHVCVRMRVLV